MLTISRKKNEGIVIGDGITLSRRKGDEDLAATVMTDRARAAEPEAGTSRETRQLVRSKRGIGRDDDDAAAAWRVTTPRRRVEQAANGNAVDAQLVVGAEVRQRQDAELTDLAWLYSMNRGIFMTPGREEEWTLTVAHDDAAVDRYVAVFAELADELTA